MHSEATAAPKRPAKKTGFAGRLTNRACEGAESVLCIEPKRRRGRNGKVLPPRFKNPRLERYTRRANSVLSVLTVAIIVAGLAWGTGTNVALNERAEAAELERHEALLNATFTQGRLLQEEIACAKTTAREEAGNQPVAEMAIVVASLKNRAEFFGTSICREAMRTHQGGWYDYSAFNFLKTAQFKEIERKAHLRNQFERDSERRAQVAAEGIILGKIPDPTGGAMYYVSRPGGQNDRQFAVFLANFAATNGLDSTPRKTSPDSPFWLFYLKPAPLPLARPDRTMEARVEPQGHREKGFGDVVVHLAKYAYTQLATREN